MKNITKNAEPVSLEQHRCNPPCDYNNYAHKDELRRSLLDEQGFLCCFCMTRLGTRDAVPLGTQMKVAHWHSQSLHPGEDLDYINLLGACPGGEGKPEDQQHCDTYQRNRDLLFNPANATHDVQSRVRYLGDGTMESDHADFDRQLNEVLNLNKGYLLRQNRKAVIEMAIADVSKDPGSRTRQELQTLIAQWGALNAHGRFREYCCVAIYYLKRKLAKTA